jgi:hypothetical protein
MTRAVNHGEHGHQIAIHAINDSIRKPSRDKPTNPQAVATYSVDQWIIG